MCVNFFTGRIIKILDYQKRLSSATGLEPAIFGAGNRCLILLATRPLVDISQYLKLCCKVLHQFSFYSGFVIQQIYSI